MNVKRIWGGLLLLGMLVMATAVFAVEQPKIVKMESGQGNVLFHHEEHLVAVEDCTDCHHMGLEAGGCRDCHGVDKTVAGLKLAFHRQCRNCHIKISGPTECDGCHKK